MDQKTAPLKAEDELTEAHDYLDTLGNTLGARSRDSLKERIEHIYRRAEAMETLAKRLTSERVTRRQSDALRFVLETFAAAGGAPPSEEDSWRAARKIADILESILPTVSAEAGVGGE